MTPELKARLEELSKVRPTRRRTYRLNVRGVTPREDELTPEPVAAPKPEPVTIHRSTGERARPNRSLTIEQEHELSLMTAPDREIAAYYGIVVSTVSRIRTKLGVVKGPDPDRADRLQQKREEREAARAVQAQKAKEAHARARAAIVAARQERDRAICEAQGSAEEIAVLFDVSRQVVWKAWREGGRPTNRSMKRRKPATPKPA